MRCKYCGRAIEVSGDSSVFPYYHVNRNESGLYGPCYGHSLAKVAMPIERTYILQAIKAYLASSQEKV